VNYRLTDDSALRFAYARYLMPTSNVRDTLGDFVNQYTGYAQTTTTTLGLAAGVPQQTLTNPFPSNNPVIEPYGQAYGRYTALGTAVSLDQYELRPQINDRFNLSYQRQVWWGVIVDASSAACWCRIRNTRRSRRRTPTASRSEATSSRSARSGRSPKGSASSRPTPGATIACKVTRKRTDGQGREVQIGLRFVF
jgi:hypothetical protein